MGKKNGKQKARLEEVPEEDELEEGEEFYDYSAEEDGGGYGLSDMMGGEGDNSGWGAAGYDSWGGGKSAEPVAASGDGWGNAGGWNTNTVPTPAQMAAQHAAPVAMAMASASKGKKPDKKDKSGPAWQSWGTESTGGDAWNQQKPNKKAKGGQQPQAQAWESWGREHSNAAGGEWAGSAPTQWSSDWPATEDQGGWGQPPTHNWNDDRQPKVTSVLSPQHQYDALQALLTGSHAPQTSDGKKARGTQEKGGKKAQQHQQHQQQGKKGKKNKQQQADPWGGGGGWDDGGWGASHQENDHDYDDDDDEEDRRVHFTPITAGVWGGSQHDSYHMPSKTLAHAYQGTSNQTPLFAGFPSRNKISEEADIQFIDSKGSALVPVQQALFGYATRKAKDRIHWMFSPNKDERVSSLLSWIEIMSDHIGAYGLHRFLQSRERGALIANADYRPQSNPNEPAFDWLTFDQLQASRDKILQESVAFYDPGVTTIVFVFLPSKSGNSLAMWRRKINIRPSLRTSRINEISLAKAGLRKEKDYIVHVDELPKKPGETRKSSAHAVPTKSAMKYDYAKGYYPYETYEKKKKKWWNIFG